VSIGIFFIVLGLALLVATNDMLKLGNVRDYFTWETAMDFYWCTSFTQSAFHHGINSDCRGRLVFFLTNLDIEFSGIIKTVYWPAVIIIAGLGFILSFNN